MSVPVNDICAVIATSDYARSRSWYSRVIGREPDLEPVQGVAEWQMTNTAWLQLIDDPDRAGKSAVRIGVTDLAAQIKTLNDLGVGTAEPVVIADMVRVVDVPDPDGNEVSYVEEVGTQGPSRIAAGRLS
jgi:catechol 2,3-dioxygenase-like lactoylglutathione lyase family enzyme